MRRRDEDVRSGTAGGGRRSRRRIGDHGRRGATEVETDQDGTRRPVVHDNRAREQRVANRIGGNGEVARLRRDLHLGGAGAQTAWWGLARLRDGGQQNQ